MLPFIKTHDRLHSWVTCSQDVVLFAELKLLIRTARFSWQALQEYSYVSNEAYLPPMVMKDIQCNCLEQQF